MYVMAVHIFIISHRRIRFTQGYSNIYACDRLYFKEIQRNIVDEAGDGGYFTIKGQTICPLLASLLYQVRKIWRTTSFNPSKKKLTKKEKKLVLPLYYSHNEQAIPFRCQKFSLYLPFYFLLLPFKFSILIEYYITFI